MHCQRSRFKQKVKKPEDEMLQAFFMEEENADNYRSHLCFFIFDSFLILLGNSTPFTEEM